MKKIVGIVLVILVIVFIGYKTMTLIRYGVHKEEAETCNEVLDKIWIRKDKVTVKTKVLDDNNYLVNDNVKIKINGEIGEEIAMDFTYTYKFYPIDSGKEFEKSDKAIMFGKENAVLRSLNNLKENEEYTKIIGELQKIIEEKNITNDLDIIKYLCTRKGSNIRSNIFTSTKQMKEDMLVYTLCEYFRNQYIESGKGITLIEGDYTGYIGYNEKDGATYSSVSITKDDYTYNFIFSNFDEQEMLEAINTIVIE